MTPQGIAELSLLLTGVSTLLGFGIFFKLTFVAGKLAQQQSQNTKDIAGLQTDVKEMRESPVWAKHAATH